MNDRNLGGLMTFCLAAALCVSLRTALLLLTALPLATVFTLAAVLLLRHLRLPVSPALTVLLAGGVGGALLSLLLAAVSDSGAALGKPVPVLLLLILCGCGVSARQADAPWRIGRLLQATVLLLLIGAVREVLSVGRIAGYPLPITPFGDTFGHTASGMVGVGGILLAAILAWLFRLRGPVPSATLTAADAGAIGLLTAVVCGGCLLWEQWLPELGGHGRLGAALLLTGAMAIVMGCLFPRTTFLQGHVRMILPVAAALLMPRDADWLTVLLAGGGVFLLVLAGTTVLQRLSRSRVAFSASVLLTMGALILAAFTAV